MQFSLGKKAELLGIIKKVIPSLLTAIIVIQVQSLPFSNDSLFHIYFICIFITIDSVHFPDFLLPFRELSRPHRYRMFENLIFYIITSLKLRCIFQSEESYPFNK